MKKGLILLLVVFFGFISEIGATHIIGGEIIWKCVGSQYKFTVRIYRDCGGTNASLPTIISLATNSGVTISCPRITLADVSPTCYLPALSPSCGVTASGEGAIEVGIYESGLITLNGTPPSSGWSFTWTSCCRPFTITNIVNPGSQSFTLRAYMFPYTTPAGVILSANPCYDDSPNFLEDPKVVACGGLNVVYNNLGFDSNLDSLYYNWAPAWTTVNTIVPYAAGYSFSNPLPSTTQNPANQAVVLDNISGQTRFKSFTPGSFATVLKIEEYRFGQKIGEIYRAIPIYIKTCIPIPSSPTNPCGGVVNSQPTLTIEVDTIIYPNAPPVSPVVVNGDTVYYESTVYAKEKLNFKVTSFDTDLRPNCVSQDITFAAFGGNLSSAIGYGNPNVCLYNPPCAIITSLNTGGGFVSKLNNQVEFEWQTACNHLTYQQYAGGSFKSVYEFYFRMEDDACPAPAFTYGTVKINILNYPPIPPDFSNSCVSLDEITGDMSIDWIPPLDTGINFDYYVMYHSNSASGPYAAVDTFFNYSDNSFTHSGQPSGTHYYFMRTGGGCDLISETSDTLSLMNMTLVPTPPSNSYVAALSWTPYKTGSTTGTYYQIWRRTFPNGTWQIVDSTAALIFNDTVNVCGDDLEYQIRVGGKCYSTTDHALFSDQVNADIIKIDSITVSGGLSTLYWNFSGSTDVDRYLVMIYDGSIPGYVVIDTIDANTLTLPYVYASSSANSKSEQFIIVTLDSCNNQSSDQNAIPHNTMFLEKFIEGCDGFVKLLWNNYATWPGGATYNVMADITDLSGQTTYNVLVNANDTSTEFKHTSIINGYEYCYYIRAIDSTGLYTSTSNRICVNSTVIQKTRLLYLASTNVRSNGSIEIFGFLDKEADVKTFNIERAVSRLGPYLSIGTIPMPIQPPYILKYSDYTALPNENRYFYRFSAIDVCNFVDTVSNYGTNINLSVTSGNMTNTLVWKRYQRYGGVVGNYSVYRAVDNNGNWQLVTDQLGANDTVYKDDITPFANSRGAFCYYVVAIEKDNPLGFLDENGQPFSSKSNDACITHDARIFLPTAFNPQSNIEVNKLWKPQNVFAEKNSYLLNIYNRWGEKVFSTKNVNEGWDGHQNGQLSPTGVYNYYVNYKSLNGLPIEERGSFTLIN